MTKPAPATSPKPATAVPARSPPVGVPKTLAAAQADFTAEGSPPPGMASAGIPARADTAARRPPPRKRRARV